VHLDVNPGRPEPIYRQIVEQIRRGSASGRLAVGERLPSVRELATTLVVNPNTIAKAYTELEREGIVFTKKGAGTFVADCDNPLKASEKRRILVEKIDELLTAAVHLGFKEDDLRALIETRLKEFKLA